MNAPPISKRLVAIVGAAAAAALFAFTPTQEGRVLTTYRDIGGVLTYCDGATENAQWGKAYSSAECNAQLDKDLTRHAEGVMRCIHVPLTPGQTVAFVDTAYNVGVPAFCGSSMAKKSNAHDMAGACAALSLWVNVNGKPVSGLVKRRAAARAFCEGRKPV